MVVNTKIEGPSMLKHMCSFFAFILLSLAQVLPGQNIPVNEIQKLKADDAQENDYLGESVYVSGNYLVAGSPFGNSGKGKVYVFDKQTGDLLYKFDNVNGSTQDSFGRSIAISGDKIFIGAPGHNNSGSVFIFSLSDGSFLGFLIPGHPMEQGDGFGEAMAISETQLAVGAPNQGFNSRGAVFIFELNDFNLNQRVTSINQSDYQHFGSNISLNNDFLLVGIPFDNNNNLGESQLFNANNGQFISLLTPPFLNSNDYFGSSVTLTDEYAVISATGDDTWGNDTGTAYVFDLQTQEVSYQLYANDPNIHFAYRLRSSGNILIADGANSLDNWKTSVYGFDLSTGQEAFQISSQTNDDGFGYYFDIQGKDIIVGAQSDSEFVPYSGAAYHYQLDIGPSAPTDITLSSNSIMEDQPTGTLIGLLNAQDDDFDDSFTFEFAVGEGDSDNTLFSISGANGDELISNQVFDFELQNSYSIRLKVTDSQTNTFEKSFIINVIKNPDTDGDGFSDDTELALGTNPNDSTSYPQFSEQQFLQAPEIEGFSYFGSSIKVFSNIGVIGAPGENNGGLDRGSAYLFDLDTGTSTFKLTAIDAASNDFFGESVGVSESYAIVGAPFKNQNAGGAYVFNRSTGQEIMNLPGSSYEEFGKAVAVSEEYAIVGAWRNDINGYETGSVYIYNMLTGHERFLYPNIPLEYDNFGYSLDIKGNIAVIGAPGRERAFIFNLDTEEQLFELTSDSGLDGYFGECIYIHNDMVAIGAPSENNVGAVYLFDLTSGERIRKITPENPGIFPGLGTSVAMNDYFLVAGAPFEGKDDINSVGAAYVFDIQTGRQLTKLSPEFGGERNYFGTSVEINDQAIYVGKKGDQYGAYEEGAVHIYTFSGGDGSVIEFTPSAGGTLLGEHIQLIPEGGDTSPVEAIPETGYYFDKWVLNSGNYEGFEDTSIQHDNPITLTNVTENLALTAQFFEDINYTVIYNSGQNGSVNINSETVRNGQSSSPVTAIPDEGYEFIAWTGDISSSQNPLNIESVTSDLHINAVFGKTFISKWDTTITDLESSSSKQIKLPLKPFAEYDFIVDWGDGQADHITQYNQAEILHTYDTPGVYTVRLSGLIKGWAGDASLDSPKLLEISRWGDLEFTNGTNFKNSTNLIITATDIPDISAMTDATSLFDHCSSITSIPNIGQWDVSNITNMSKMFFGASNFNSDISNWDVSKTTDMSSMFYLASSFNSDVSSWNVSNVNNINHIFAFTSSFNSDVSNWDVSKVTNFGGTFREASLFNQDISGWNVSNAREMYSMFAKATAFTGDISNWDVSKVRDFSAMFASTNYNGDISGWDVSSAYDMSTMFFNNAVFNQDISGWNVSGVNDMQLMFEKASSFNQDISGWDVSNVTRMGSMFKNATSFNQDISSWNVSKVNDMYNIFTGITLSTTIYDNILNSWELIAHPRIRFHGGFSKYSSASEAARNRLIADHSWTITDGGKVYTVNFSAGANGSVSQSGNQFIDLGESTTEVLATANTGYYFDNWTVTSGTYDGESNSDLATDNPLTVNNISDDLSLSAVFSPLQYEVNFASDSRGTLSGNTSQSISYTRNSSPVTAIPNEGYVFKQWSGDITSTDNPLIIENVTGPVSVTAEYELDDSLRMEFGKASVTNSWQSILFTKEFKDPVVIVGPPSRNEADYLTVRLRNTTLTGFEIRLQEWEYLDGTHAAEDVYYIVVERGSYTLPSGQKLVAGSIEASGGSFSTYTFGENLTSSPALLSNVATFNDPAAVTRRVKNVTTNGFELRLQEADADVNGQNTVQDHGSETVNFLAIEKGFSSFDGKGLLIDTISPIDERVKDVGILDYEYFIASDQTYAGSDNGTLRMQGSPETGAQLIFEEEQSKDSEIAHANETAAYIAILEQDDVSTDEPLIEVNNLSINSEWQLVLFEKAFSDPIVITGPLSSNEAEAASVKIRNVTANGFQIKIQEFAYQDQIHANEDITYMVIERGRYILPDGKKLIADSTDLSNSTRKTINYGLAMSSTPNVFSSIVTDNDPVAVVTRVRNITNSNFQIKLREAEINNQNHVSETVHYLAVESGSITTSSYELLVTNMGSVRHTPVAVDPQDYSMFIAKQQTENGGDTAWVRRTGNINVFIEEEQSKDTELNHTNETVSYILVKNAAIPANLTSNETGTNETKSNSIDTTSTDTPTEESELFEAVSTPLEPDEDLRSLRSFDELILPTTTDYIEATLRDGSIIYVYLEQGSNEAEVLSEDTIRIYYDPKPENWILDFKEQLNLLGYDVVSASIVNDLEIIIVDYFDIP